MKTGEGSGGRKRERGEQREAKGGDGGRVRREEGTGGERESREKRVWLCMLVACACCV